MLPPVPPEIIDLARRIASEHALVCAVVGQESAWNRWAVRYEPGFLSRYVAPLHTAGQVAREFGFEEPSLAALCDVATGLEFGCRILAARLARAKGDVSVALLAWNGGVCREAIS